MGQIVMSLIVQIGACGIAALIGAVVIGLATKLLLKFTPSYGIRYLAAFCGYIPLFVGRFLLAEFLGPYLTENNLPATAWLAPMTLTVVIWIVLQAVIYAVIIKGPKKDYIVLSSAFIISLLHFAVLAAAVPVVILIAVLIGILPFGNTVTFADVVEPILNSKTVILDLIIGGDQTGPVMHEIVADSRIRRTLSNLPSIVQILDLDGGRMLVLDTDGKTAAYIDIQGDVADRTRNYVEFLRQIIRQLQEGQVEKLGEQLIDGQKVIGFAARGQNEEVTIWADAQTGHPIRIEAQIGQEFAFIMKNFEFDVPVDGSLVSMDVPAGYTLQEKNLDVSNSTEKDFVESLRIWAEIIGDGTFPEAIGTENAMKVMPTLIQKMTQMQVSEEEGTQLGTSFGKGMIFHQILENQGQWNYAGAGVKLGDAGKAIFWYPPQGSQTYRVIYGDLSVKDVAEENLPK